MGTAASCFRAGFCFMCVQSVWEGAAAFILVVAAFKIENTERFIMHSGITKIYCRKTVGHVFTKPVQVEGTTQKFFPSKLFFIVVHTSAARRCECM
jgi:hypothetical protein